MLSSIDYSKYNSYNDLLKDPSLKKLKNERSWEETNRIISVVFVTLLLATLVIMGSLMMKDHAPKIAGLILLGVEAFPIATGIAMIVIAQHQLTKKRSKIELQNFVEAHFRQDLNNKL